MRKGKRQWGWGRIDKKPSGYVVRYFDGKADRHVSVAKALGKPANEVTYADAKALLDRLILAKKTGTVLLPSRSTLTVQAVLEAYLQAMRGRRSYRSLKSEADAVIRWIGTERLAALSAPRLRELKVAYEELKDEAGAPKFEKNTVKNRLGVLHAAWMFAHEELGAAEPPTFPKVEDQKIRRVKITAEEFAAIHPALKAFDPADDIAELLWYVALRPTEACELEWDRIDQEGRRWRIRLDEIDTKTKQARWREVVEPELQGLLERRWVQRSPKCPHLVFHRQGQPVLYHWLREHWRAACAQVGVVDRNLHDFRRGLYSRLLNAGVDLLTAMEIVGHKSLTTAKRYVLSEPGRQVSGLQKVIQMRNSRGTRAP